MVTSTSGAVRGCRNGLSCANVLDTVLADAGCVLAVDRGDGLGARPSSNARMTSAGPSRTGSWTLGGDPIADGADVMSLLLCWRGRATGMAVVVIAAGGGSGAMPSEKVTVASISHGRMK